MANLYNVKLTKLVEVFHLKPVFQATDYEKICITVDDVSRPGMQLTRAHHHPEYGAAARVPGNGPEA